MRFFNYETYNYTCIEEKKVNEGLYSNVIKVHILGTGIYEDFFFIKVKHSKIKLSHVIFNNKTNRIVMTRTINHAIVRYIFCKILQCFAIVI